MLAKSFQMVFRCVLACCLFYWCSLQCLHAQSSLTDTTCQNRLQEAVKFYSRNIGANSFLYNAPEYVWLYPGTKGHPYFLSDTLQKGTLQYDGIIYYDVPLLYEMIQQTLVIAGYNETKLKLHAAKIQGFTIEGRQFTRLEAVAQAGADSSFYEVMYDEKELSVLVKRRKEIRRSGRPEDPNEFKEFATHFIRSKGQYHKVDSEASLLDALNDKRSEIKKFLRAKKLGYRKNPEATMFGAVAHYAEIK